MFPLLHHTFSPNQNPASYNKNNALKRKKEKRKREKKHTDEILNVTKSSTEFPSYPWKLCEKVINDYDKHELFSDLFYYQCYHYYLAKKIR